MWSRRSIEVLIVVSLLAATTACTVTPRFAAPPAQAPAGAGKPVAAGPPPVPAAAQQGFGQALALARAGNDPAAEAQLASMARQYPQFHTPLVDLGILYRQSGDLAAATKALRQAIARDPHSAPAWTELGIAQRLGGKFADAERSYTHAIAANPAYAAAYRDRGVLRDLYLDEPAAALADFEEYRKLAAADKPVAMWIAELQHRAGAVPVAVHGGRAPGPPSPGRALAGARTHLVSSLKGTGSPGAAAAPRPQARN